MARRTSSIVRIDSRLALALPSAMICFTLSSFPFELETSFPYRRKPGDYIANENLFALNAANGCSAASLGNRATSSGEE